MQAIKLFLIGTSLFAADPVSYWVEPCANPENLFHDDDAEPRRGGLKELLRAFFGSRLFWLACALSLGTTILRETFGLWTPTYFTQAAGMNVAQAASRSALFPFVGGISVILCGWLSDRLGHGGRALLLVYGLLLAGAALLALGGGVAEGSRILPVVFVGLIAFLIVGPYSFLGGAISLDFGGKRASGTASGLIDGVGYLGGILSGDSVARISVGYGWNRAFLLLAAISFASSFAAVAYLRHGKRTQ